jgi:hypothetical protein
MLHCFVLVLAGEDSSASTSTSTNLKCLAASVNHFARSIWFKANANWFNSLES